jgi:hypothetical protein
MTNGRDINTLLCLFLIVSVAALCACARPEQPKVEEPPPARIEPPGPQPAPPATKARAVRPPDPVEVRSKTKTILKDAVVPDSSRGQGFTAGDFNGDGSEDLAVIVKPVEAMLEEINGEFAGWILGDPLTVALPAPVMMVQSPPARPQPVRVEKGDVLLAVIHGHGANGWRDPEATQTYLLKNVAGNNIRPQSASEVLKEYANNKGLPALHGDVIAQTIGSGSGFLYYTGAKYAWYDPEYYKAGASKRRVH